MSNREDKLIGTTKGEVKEMCRDMPPLELAIQFHGHICPGLLMGVRAAEFAREQLGVGPDRDEELVAIVETDSCGVDAIQAILGCTFGKGNLIFRDYGKNVYTIISREKGRAIRIAQKFGSLKGRDSERYHELARKNELTESETSEKENLLGVIFEKIMSSAFTDLFDWREVDVDIPVKAQIHSTIQCAGCGEGVMATRARETDQGWLCPTCLDQIGGKVSV
ncbi:MAG TPA: FmdE family protein [Syntrophomonadaceae bacterium]|nr:FmdE family protein [Syntrophomonadaceae bacterium]